MTDDLFSNLPQEQQVQAEQIYNNLKDQADVQLRRMAMVLASKPDHQLLADTEFQIRDHVHRIGAMALESVLQERKKGGIRGAVVAVPTTAEAMPSSRDTEPAH